MSLPNIIFIVLDTLRADKVYSQYKDRNLVPTLSSLSENSIYFKKCIANSPWTYPSHVSMFTGLYPSQIDLLNNNPRRLNKKVPIITEILKDLGYYTICYTENPWISKNFGLTRGFNRVYKKLKFTFIFKEKFKFFDYVKKRLDKFYANLNRKIKSKILLKHLYNYKFNLERRLDNLKKRMFWRKILIKHFIDSINSLGQLSKKLEKSDQTKPFYLFFNTMANHYPYFPIRRALKYCRLSLNHFKKVLEFHLKPANYTINSYDQGNFLSERKIRAIKKLYDACVYYNDLIVEKIISILKNLDKFKNSYIIITSDHGEHLFDKLDHYLWGHGNFQSLYESIIRVPLIIYNSKIKKRIISNQVQLKDLFHTILHLTGILGEKNNFLDKKKSILYQIDNGTTPKYIYGEHLKSLEEKLAIIKQNREFIKQNQIPKIFNNIYFLRSESYKYINYNDKIEEFYELQNDPFEQINVFNINNEECNKMKQNLENFLNYVTNPEEIKDLITKKEKKSIQRIIGDIKIKGLKN